MKYIGLDVGTRRIGIARSDEKGAFAFPVSVIHVRLHKNEYQLEQAYLEVCDFMKQEGQMHEVEIVLGDSKNSKGDDNAIMLNVRELQKLIEERGYRTYLEPEYFTSQHASHFTGEGPLHDASAAALILQRFLDKKHN